MESKDLKLIEELMKNDVELERLWSEHLDFERRLEEMNRKPYLTSEEQVEQARLKKLKLAGRDRIEAILAAHRQEA